MGTSVSMIESYYGTLIDTANESAILTQLEGFGHHDLQKRRFVPQEQL